jgi:hypothetical protein
VTIPPHNLDAEQAVLGAVLQHDADGVLALLAERLAPTDFYIEAHRTIYGAMLTLRRAQRPVDAITLASVLRATNELDAVGGPPKLALLAEAGLMAIPANVGAYVEEIRTAAQKRDLLALSLKVGHAASNGGKPETIVAEIIETLAAIERRPAGGRRAPLGVGLGEFFALDALELQADVYIEGLLTADTSGWISGEEKTGKTLAALDEALCLALQRPVFGRFHVPQRRRVLFVEEEDPSRRVHARLRALVRGHGLDPDDEGLRSELDDWFRLAVWEGVTLDNPVMVGRLRATLEAFKPAVVFLDVLRKMTGSKDLNKATEASALLGVLDELRRAYGVVFLVLHHYRKAQGFRVGRGSQEIGGSYVLSAWAEASLFFEPIGRKQGAVRVTVQTKDGAPVPPFRLRIEAEGPTHAPTLLRLLAEDDASSATNDVDDLVVQAIAALPKTEALDGKPGVTRAALIEALKKSDKTVRRALDRLTDAGRILVTGKAAKSAALYAAKAE